MVEKKPITRIVKLKEIADCPTLRLDPNHYIPRHRRWECRKGDRLRSRGALVRAWLDGEIKLGRPVRGHEDNLRIGESSPSTPLGKQVCGAGISALYLPLNGFVEN